jgi:erythromycin esterase-like protein
MSLPPRHPDPDRVAAVRAAALPLDDDEPALDELLGRIGDARFVLLGEASHGTREFYELRERLTRRLVARHGFDAVAIEGDWPDAWRVNRHVRGLGADTAPADALAGFRRFPTWMWRNPVVAGFVAWLRAWNAALPPGHRCGFYGLDLYSLGASMAAVLAYLDEAEPALAARVRARYDCFAPFGGDTQAYGLMTGLGSTPSCAQAALATLVDLQRRRARRADAADGDDAEAAFDAEQNAALVRDAERYYRTMFLSDVSSWNERDSHMARTLWAIDAHLSRPGRPARVVVWAHNSHLGDARATEMGARRGEHNLGQLVRERHGGASFLLGFTTHDGRVTAAHDWDGDARSRRVNPSRGDAVEGLLHAVGRPRFWLPLRDDARLKQALDAPLLERAIGVIYRPETERESHYFEARVARQFDALVHVDRTHALEPLDRGPQWHAAEAPEAFPQGL